jgi:glutamate--cysteine ligase
MITSKEHIIDYFNSGIRSSEQFKIGVEQEKFLFDLKTNKRADYQIILKMFEGLYEFGWKPILENKNIIGLKKVLL